MVIKKIFVWLIALAASITTVNPAARAAVEAAAVPSQELYAHYWAAPARSGLTPGIHATGTSHTTAVPAPHVAGGAGVGPILPPVPKAASRPSPSAFDDTKVVGDDAAELVYRRSRLDHANRAWLAAQAAPVATAGESAGGTGLSLAAPEAPRASGPPSEAVLAIRRLNFGAGGAKSRATPSTTASGSGSNTVRSPSSPQPTFAASRRSTGDSAPATPPRTSGRSGGGAAAATYTPPAIASRMAPAKKDAESRAAVAGSEVTPRPLYDLSPIAHPGVGKGAPQVCPCHYAVTTAFAQLKKRKSDRPNNLENICLTQEDGFVIDSRGIQLGAARSFGIFETTTADFCEALSVIRETPVQAVHNLATPLHLTKGSPDKENKIKARTTGTRSATTVADYEIQTAKSALVDLFKDGFSFRKDKGHVAMGSAVYFMGPFVGVVATPGGGAIMFKDKAKPTADEAPQFLQPEGFQLIDHQISTAAVYRALNERAFVFMASPSFWIKMMYHPSYGGHDTDDFGAAMAHHIVGWIKEEIDRSKGPSTEHTLQSALKKVLTKVFGDEEVETDVCVSLVRIMPLSLIPAAPAVGGCGCSCFSWC